MRKKWNSIHNNYTIFCGLINFRNYCFKKCFLRFLGANTLLMFTVYLWDRYVLCGISETCLNTRSFLHGASFSPWTLNNFSLENNNWEPHISKIYCFSLFVYLLFGTELATADFLNCVRSWIVSKYAEFSATLRYHMNYIHTDQCGKLSLIETYIL